MKIVHKILLVLTLIVCMIVFMIFYAFSIAPMNYTVRKESLTSTEIPEQMEGFRILFFSDLEYGTFVNQKRAEMLVSKVNSLDPDLIIFGGDLYDADAEVTDEKNAELITALRQMEAQYGKFAVLGDNDCRDERVLGIVKSILYQADFEILDNSSIVIHRGGSQGITLIGLGNELNSTADIAGVYSAVSTDSYTITVCHTPDTADKVPYDQTDYFLAGHSHGGQAYWLWDALYTPAMAVRYLRGKHSIQDEFILDITNGTGTTGTDVRFLADAEVAVYTLHQFIVPETPAPETTEEVPAESTEDTESEEEPADESVEEVPEEEASEEESTEEETPEESGD